MIRRLVGAICLSVMATHALAADPVEIGIGYLGHAGCQIETVAGSTARRQ